MEYLSLTQKEREKMQAQELHGIELQHFQFELQAQRETDLLKALPADDWPEEIAKFRGKGRDQIFKEAATPEQAQLAADYAIRDHLKLRRDTALLEKNRTECNHAAALKQFASQEVMLAAIAAECAEREGTVTTVESETVTK